MSSSTLEEFLKSKAPLNSTTTAAPEQPVAENSKALQSFLGAPLDANANVAFTPIKPRAGTPAHSKSGPVKKLQPQMATPAPATSVEATGAVSTPASLPNISSAPTPTKPFPWFKHIQMIESALRIGDMHFAETLLTVLTDVADVLDDTAAKVRLKAFSARVKMEQRQIPEAEKMLMETLSAIEHTPGMSTIGAAYCLHALAQCYLRSGRAEKAEKAQAMAASLAEKILGSADPEAKMFKQPLAV